MTTVMTGTNGGTQAVNGLFSGISFFLVQRLPIRASYVSKVQSQGGRVVKLEAQADYIIADHLRPDCPAGSLSYTFIDTALRNGQLPEPDQHRAGPERNAARVVGSTCNSGKQTRTPFTAADDKLLLEWVESSKLRGLTIKGNELYKQLEAHNDRHTWQSWRDRYVKTLSGRSPALISQVQEGLPHQAHPRVPSPTPGASTSQPAARQANQGQALPAQPQSQKKRKDRDELPDGYTDADIDRLVGFGDDIVEVPSHWERAAWKGFAEEEGSHSAREWQILWEYVAKPKYELMKRQQSTAIEQPGNQVTESAHAKDASKAIDLPVRGLSQEEGTPLPPRSAKRARTADTSALNGNQQANVKKEPSSEVGVIRPVEMQPASEGALIQSAADARQTQDPQIPPTVPQRSTPALRFEEEDPLEASKRRLFGFSLPSENTIPSGSPAELPQPVQSPAPAAESSLRERLHDEIAELATAEANRAADLQLRHNMESDDSSHEARPALTEANLASHRTTHQAPSLRAADLLEDDENHDQTELIDFLKSVVKTPVKPKEGKKEVEAPRSSENGQRPSRMESEEAGREEEEEIDPHILSEQDINDVIDKTSKWPFDEDTAPASKTAVKRAHSPQPAPFERTPAFESQPETNGDPDSMHEHDEREAQDKSVDHTVEDSDIPDSSSVLPGSIDGLEEGDLLDLSLAPPEGGWAATPSDDDPANGIQDSREPETHMMDLEDDAVQLGKGDVTEHNGIVEISDDEELDSNVEDEMEHDLPYDQDYHKPAAHKVVDVSSHMSTSSFDEDDDDDDVALTHSQTQHTSNRVIDTQAVLDMDTQQHDFEFPAPLDSPGSPVDAEEYNRRKREQERATKSRSGSYDTLQEPEPEEEDVDVYIPNLQAQYGYTESDIVYALERSSMRPQLAELALEANAAGNGWPATMRGFWSEDEDEIIREGHPEKLKAVTQKHGWEEVIARSDWLDKYKQAPT